MRINARLAAVTAVQRSSAPPASGACAVRRAGVLQRLLRDASCLQHHISANQVSHELSGRVARSISSAFVFKGETVQNAVTTSSALGLGRVKTLEREERVERPF